MGQKQFRGYSRGILRGILRGITMKNVVLVSKFIVLIASYENR